MLVSKTISEFKEHRLSLIKERCSALNRRPIIGFVPTMGNLHEGHYSLIRTMVRECDISTVSIFVNPTQFGPTEDFREYPRTPQEDIQGCEREGVDILFFPTDSVMYPRDFQTAVSVRAVSKPFEGEVRPSHFEGVAVVCCKLFNIVAPEKAYFGQKDFQQFRVVERMVCDLNIPVEIVLCPTVREPDGLAMSSRNRYLTERERAEAVTIFKCLTAIEDAFASGERDVLTLQEIGRTQLASSIRLQYLSIADSLTLEEREETCVDGDVVLVAGVLGRTHLIDNIILGGRS